MISNFLRFVKTAASCSVFLTIPATANEIIITVTGTMISYQSPFNPPDFTTAIDYAGIFGPVGTSLNGAGFTVVYSIDTTCGGNCASSTTSLGYNEIIGGTSEKITKQGITLPTNSPFLSTMLIVNGISVAIGTAEDGVARVQSFGTSLAFQSSSGFTTLGHSQINTELDSRTSKISDSLFTPFTAAFDPLTDFHALGYDKTVDGGLWLRDTSNRTQLMAALLVTTVTLDNPAFTAVPGPNAGGGIAGLILIVGFALIRPANLIRRKTRELYGCFHQ